jgi:hypothetical protein
MSNAARTIVPNRVKAAETYAMRVSKEYREALTDDYLIAPSPKETPLQCVFYQLKEDIGVHIDDMVIAAPRSEDEPVTHHLLWRVRRTEEGDVLVPCSNDVDQKPRPIDDYFILGSVTGAQFNVRRGGRLIAAGLIAA